MSCRRRALGKEGRGQLMRLGIDLGGTKTEILALDGRRASCCAAGCSTPRDYDGTLKGHCRSGARSREPDRRARRTGPRHSRHRNGRSGAIKNANSTWLQRPPAARAIWKRATGPHGAAGQ